MRVKAYEWKPAGSWWPERELEDPWGSIVEPDFDDDVNDLPLSGEGLYLPSNIGASE